MISENPESLFRLQSGIIRIRILARGNAGIRIPVNGQVRRFGESRALLQGPLWVLLWLCLLSGFGSAQPAVNVTITADDPVLIPGQTTTIRVFARIDPSVEADAEGIFSWYVDVLNSDGAIVVPDYDNLTMTSSDNVPDLSSSGTTAGTNRLGIHNTYLGDPDAGKGGPVELLAVQVTAGQPGGTILSVRAGTTEPSITDDFLVTSSGGGAPFTGGNYAMANVMLKVVPVSAAIKLGISKTAGGGVDLNFTPISGYSHTVMFSEDMSPGSWVALPGAPHDSGGVSDPAVGLPRRFYSVFVSKQ